jgi:hypothetical protein
MTGSWEKKDLHGIDLIKEEPWVVTDLNISHMKDTPTRALLGSSS